MATPLSIGELTAIGIGLGNIAAWSKLIYDARKNNQNGNGKGGKYCPSHLEVAAKIATIEANKLELDNNLSSLHKENREDHQQIFAEIKSLSVSVASAAASAASAAATAANVASRRGKQ